MTDDATYIPERDHAHLSAAVPCGTCKTFIESERLDAAALPDNVTCTACGDETPLAFDAHVTLADAGAAALDGCPRCGYHTLCIQKDLNARFGVLLVTVSFGALLFSGLSIPKMLIGLVALAIVDWLLLRAIVKRVLICYRCKAQYRGFRPGARCRPFDLATWEAHDDALTSR